MWRGLMCAPGPISGAAARLIFTQTHDTVPSDRDCRPARCIAKALVKRGKAGDALATSDPVSDERVVRSVVLSAALMATARGIPMLLAGEESLEFRSEPWPVPPHFDGARGGRAGAAAGVFACYRALLHLRRNVVPATGAEGVTAGLTGDHVRVVHDNPHVGVVVWHRWRSGGPPSSSPTWARATSRSTGSACPAAASGWCASSPGATPRSART